MRTFLGNISSMFLGICLGGLLPPAFFGRIVLLLERFGLAERTVWEDALFLGDEPIFTLFRILLSAATIYCTAYMVANLAVSHKTLLALLTNLPIFVIGYLLIFIPISHTDGEIMSLLLWFETETAGMQAVLVLSSLSTMGIFGATSWFGARKGMSMKNLLTNRLPKKPISHRTYLHADIYPQSSRFVWKSRE